MDYKNLNKYKYIYHIYQSGNIIHIEKYPVIYINSKVIYFKTGRKEYLSCQHLCNFVNATEYSPKYYKWYDKYFIGKEKEVKEIFEDLKQHFKIVTNYTFNVFNSNTVLELKQLDISRFTISPESDFEKIMDGLLLAVNLIITEMSQQIKLKEVALDK